MSKELHQSWALFALPKDRFQRKFIAIGIGNIMEWYDFAVFGAFADVIGQVYFPSNGDFTVSLLKSLAVFGAAFAARPLGGAYFGYIGDVYGRKRALEVSIGAMLLTSLLIGCVPSYDAMGVAASTTIVALRLVQGVAAGGELVGAMIYTVENTSSETHGFWGACVKATGNFGVALGMGTATILRLVLTEQALLQYGWRLPFLFGILLGLLGLRLRMLIFAEEQRGEGRRRGGAQEGHDGVDLEDHGVGNPMAAGAGEVELALSPSHVRARGSQPSSAAVHSPLLSLEIRSAPSIKAPSGPSKPYDTPDTDIRSPPLSYRWYARLSGNLLHHFDKVALLVLAASLWGVGYYTVFVWMGYYLASPELIGSSGEHGFQESWLIIFAANLLLIVLMPLFGGVADRITQSDNIRRLDLLSLSPEERAMARKLHQMPNNPDNLVLGSGVRTMLRVTTCAAVLTTIPCFVVISRNADNLPVVLLALLPLICMVAAFGSAMPALLVCSIPSRLTRYTILGLGYNTSAMLFSGTAPLIQTMLAMAAIEDGVDSGLYVACYITAVALVSTVARQIQFHRADARAAAARKAPQATSVQSEPGGAAPSHSTRAMEDAATGTESQKLQQSEPLLQAAKRTCTAVWGREL